jgi:hypothetical protein
MPVSGGGAALIFSEDFIRRPFLSRGVASIIEVKPSSAQV